MHGQPHIRFTLLCVWGFHCGVTEDSSLLGCYTTLLDECFLTFQMTVEPPSYQEPLIRWCSINTEHHNPQPHFCCDFTYHGPTYQDNDNYKEHKTVLTCWLPETINYIKLNLSSHLINKMNAIFTTVKTTNKPRTAELYNKYLTAACVSLCPRDSTGQKGKFGISSCW